MSRQSRRTSRSREKTSRVERVEPGRRTWSSRWLVPVGIALVTVVAFLPVLSAGFVAYDDPENFLQNLHYRGLAWPQLRWMWTNTHLGHYVPLSWMTLGLDYVLWGMNPAGYHAVSLALHATNAMLLYFVAPRVIRLDAVDGAEGGLARCPSWHSPAHSCRRRLP